jgi:hypothetical protein
LYIGFKVKIKIKEVQRRIFEGGNIIQVHKSIGTKLKEVLIKNTI